MNRRTFEEMVSYFNQTVSDMDIDRKYKMELLGMITAILQRHDEDMKHAPTIEERKTGKWIPCSERLPEKNGRYLVTRGLKACNSIWNRVYIVNYTDLMGLIAEKIWWEGNVGKSDFQKIDDVIAWKPLEEPYKGEQE